MSRSDRFWPIADAHVSTSVVGQSPPPNRGMEVVMETSCKRPAWNRGKLVGQKSPLKLREIWAIRFRLQLAEDVRKLALFDLAIDSKLRACDLVGLHVRDVTHGAQIAPRARVIQRKTKCPVQFEISPSTRDVLTAW